MKKKNSWVSKKNINLQKACVEDISSFKFRLFVDFVVLRLLSCLREKMKVLQYGC